NSMSNRAFVTTQSLKMLKAHLKQWALDPAGWQIAHADPRAAGKSRPSLVNLNDVDMSTDNHMYYKQRWIHEYGLEQKLIVTFSPKHKRYQTAIREKQVMRARAKVDHPSRIEKKGPHSPDRFIQSTSVTPDGEIAEKNHYQIDTAKIEEEARYDGFY